MSGTEVLLDTALAHQHAGRLADAASIYEDLLATDADPAAVANNLALVYGRQGRLDAAARAGERALRARPDFPEALFNLANVRAAQERFDDAIEHYARAVRLRPDFAEARVLRGTALVRAGRVEDAVSWLEDTVDRHPDLPIAHTNLGSAYHELGRLEDALAQFDRALTLDPGYALARFNRALVRLTLGDYAGAWPDYEWRWRCQEFTGKTLPRSGDRWDGSALDGRTILVYSEQGHGDALLTSRYLPLVRRAGGRVILRCGSALTRLFSHASLADVVTGPSGALPDFDRHVPLMSLPGLFGTTLATIPPPAPHLRPSPRLIRAWEARLSTESGFKVGLCWTGSSRNSRNRQRSIDPAHLAPLAALPHVRLYRLQKDNGATRPAAAIPPLTDLVGRALDFADTAAAILQLDLVISVDTAVAHLAGSLGTPVWILLPFSADWRWLRGRDDSPWYPSARLFRQPGRDEWGPVIARVTTELRRLATAR